MKDNVRKHTASDMHHKACDVERRPSATLASLYRSTPIGKAIASASSQEFERLMKLFDVASKYPKLLELERRHGVLIGNTYATDTKCREFIMFVEETL